MNITKPRVFTGAVVGIIVVLLTGYIFWTGFTHRDMPWVYWGCWLTFFWVGSGTILACLFVPTFGEWFGNRFGSWFSGMLKIGSQDNVSANTFLKLVPVVWVLAILYGAPDFGKNIPELQHQADSYIGQAWESKMAQPLHEVWGFLTKGSKISVMEQAMGRKAVSTVVVAPWEVEVLKPRYHRGLTPWILAILVTIVALIDFPLSRRDEAKAFFGEMFRRHKERSGSARSQGGDSLPPTVAASQDSESAEEAEAPATQAQASETVNQPSGFIGGLMDVVDRIFKSLGPFASDLLAALTVSGMQKKGIFKR